MACDRIVALNVTDESAYQRYRDGTADLLAEYGGKRLYDFRVSETLASSVDHPINRVFLIRFPDKASMAEYFADPKYRSVREEYFESAVSGATLVGAYEGA
jgi:uncharacterized protein (DUF1330 family)